MEQVPQGVNEFVAWVSQELGRAAQDGWQERLQQALVRLPPTPLARAAQDAPAAPASGPSRGAPGESER
jgi:hypothetical protein